jgi:AbrB family looped-hinge helix DNA binding protein
MSLSLVIAMETETWTRINENGRLVIPSSFRRALGIEAGDEVVLRLEDDELRITTQQLRIRRAQARARKLLKNKRSLARELLAERREAAKRE